LFFLPHYYVGEELRGGAELGGVGISRWFSGIWFLADFRGFFFRIGFRGRKRGLRLSEKEEWQMEG